MGAVIFKQPNGLYGRYSYVSDGFTAINMTEEEYKVLNVDNSLRDSDYTLKRYLGDYNKVIKDARETLHSWLKNSKEDDFDSSEEYEEFIKERNEELTVLENTISKMEKPYSNNIEKEYYKSLLELVENLTSYYDKDWKLKDYVVIHHPEDMKIMTEKIKDLNKTFKNLSKNNK